ncbi:MAG: multiheme c-type cytochrome, partial [Gammaproteobacteria bacterium]
MAQDSTGSTPRPRRRYVPVVGPRLRKLLFVVFGLFSLLAINSGYLAAVTVIEWQSGETIQDYFYQLMFLGHLGLGLLIILPFLIYGVVHWRLARHRPNRRAVNVGYALFAVGFVLIASGLVLTRGIPIIEVRDPAARGVAYWLHVLTPLVTCWLFVLHRLAGRRINWRFAVGVGVAASVLSAVVIFVQAQDPRDWNAIGPVDGERYFRPSLSRTATGNFIPAQALMQDEYCAECHGDVHDSWSNSIHRFASFNNPAYLFSVRETRRYAMQRDGDVRAARFCAGCHDPAPFFSGAFDDPDFDDRSHPTANAGITCTACHAITHINSPVGNAAYTIEEPLHYPFAYSEQPFLAWLNRTLVKAKPAFHSKTFLKPLHKTAEFCGTCHKVHLPEELNGYRWLRGQNHYDSYLLSGVSGHGIRSFYYPPQAVDTCGGCHMPTQTSDDFGARRIGDDNDLRVHDHAFAAANTAIPVMVGLPESAVEDRRRFLEGALRVDIFGIRDGGSVDAPLSAPLRPGIPRLAAGETYLLETVLRTLRLGHLFTQGTADSNQVWLEVRLSTDGQEIGRSGAMLDVDGDGVALEVDPWSHFVNAWVIDRDGNRIDRRNAQDIFTSLYNHQIPPGAADVVHYKMEIPEWVTGPITVDIALKYRKFDSIYMRHIEGDEFDGNELPVTVIAKDRVVFPIGETQVSNAAPEIPQWERWNDYGIGLLRKGGAGQLRQAEEAFARVEALGRPEGPLNRARVYLREGRLDEASVALATAVSFDPPAYPWSVSYFTAVLNRQNGFLDEAIQGFREIVATEFSEARNRGFDFSKDYRLLNELAGSLFEKAKLERGDERASSRQKLLDEAERIFQQVLTMDPENTEAFWGLAQINGRLGREEEARRYRMLHGRYKTDDNARDRAVSLARRGNPAANHAAEAVVIYDLQRPGAFEVSTKSQGTT